ncbi:zeaxanthin epoxidase, chloroplastic-like [Rutidosis leptorrhynchoides]|uniref:zeaxanthin epoxidase, chloroplastic-like n=1 Tax=Rutidosis leptorrhynchoides TaxID=125765 RepID=UPI003A992597
MIKFSFEEVKDWYIKFDTFTPAVERGLPDTRAISRMALQKILANAVSVILKNGEQFEGDLLVGADGIWSKVRKNLFGLKDVTYSGYTCYTGIADFTPPDIDTVGYQVFLGHKQYFVSSDVGGGKMQWYAFHNEAAGGTDKPNGKDSYQLALELDKAWSRDDDALERT